MSFSEETQAAIQSAAGLIRDSRLAVALTGAGFSTPSGIPDFRSAGSGLWQRDDPMEVASLTVFRRRPDRFFAWIRSLSEHIWAAEPNAAHIALARLEQAGFIKATITQNIDGLHQRAGAQNVLELHGSVRTLSCSACQASYPTDAFIHPFLQDGTIPLCPACGRTLKPDIVLFEEALPEHTWQDAERYALTCDVILVAGSSLEVVPASRLPLSAVRHGAHLILVNRTPTYLDSYADVVLRDDLVDVIPELAAKIL